MLPCRGARPHALSPTRAPLLGSPAHARSAAQLIATFLTPLTLALTLTLTLTPTPHQVGALGGAAQRELPREHRVDALLQA